MEVQVGVRLCLGDTVVDFVYFAGRNEPEQLVGGGCRMRGGNGILLPDQETAERAGTKTGKKGLVGSGYRCGVSVAVVQWTLSDEKDSADGRRLMWKIAGRAIAENPWGMWIGLFWRCIRESAGCLFCHGGSYGTRRVGGRLAGNTGFNEYLQLGGGIGDCRGILFLLAVGLAVRQLLYSSRPEKGAVLGGLTAFSVFACFSYPLSVIPLVIVFVLFMALAGTLDDRKLPAEERKKDCGCMVCHGSFSLDGRYYLAIDGA